jgi:hypothetical protein
VEEGVLGLEEVKVVVHSFLLHQRRQELLAVLRNELRSQLDRVTARCGQEMSLWPLFCPRWD